jgi:hypothetical protein
MQLFINKWVVIFMSLRIIVYPVILAIILIWDFSISPRVGALQEQRYISFELYFGM